MPMQDAHHHHIPADRHAVLVDRLCELPDAPHRRQRVTELLAELGGIYPAPAQEGGDGGYDQPRDGSLTEAEKLILHLLDDLEDVSDFGRR